VRQGRDLLAPETARAPALTATQPDVLRLQGLPAAEEEVSQSGSVDHHAPTIGHPEIAEQ
jgi:hypothetical protein